MKKKSLFTTIFEQSHLKQGFIFAAFFIAFVFNFSHSVFAEEYIEVRGQVAPIIAGPSSEDPGDSDDDDSNNSGSNDSKKKKSTFTTTANPDLSVWPANFNGAKFSIQEGRPQFTTSRPAFEGKTNIQNANITLVFSYGAFSLRSTTEANIAGDWKWASPIDFPSGNFQLKLQAEHPQENSLHAGTEVAFDVNTPNNGVSWNEQFTETSSQLPFDILVRIQEQYRKVAPGESIVASIYLLNFVIPQDPLDVTIEYSIQDEAGKEIFFQKETIVVNSELSYVKAFYTQPEMPEGTYRLIAKIPSHNTLALSSAEFVIQGKGMLLLTPFAKIDYSFILMGVGIIFIIFLLLSYFEFIRFLQVRKHIHYVTGKLLKKFF